MRLLPVRGAAAVGVLLGGIALVVTLAASLPQLAHPGPWPSVQELTVAGTVAPPVTRDSFTATTEPVGARHSVVPAPATSASVPAEEAPSVAPAHPPAASRTPAPSASPTPTPTPSPTVIPSPSPSPLLRRLITALPLPL